MFLEKKTIRKETFFLKEKIVYIFSSFFLVGKKAFDELPFKKLFGSGLCF